MNFFHNLKVKGSEKIGKIGKNWRKWRIKEEKSIFLPCTLSNFNILYTKMYLLFELFPMVMVFYPGLFEIEREKGR